MSLRQHTKQQHQYQQTIFAYPTTTANQQFVHATMLPRRFAHMQRTTDDAHNTLGMQYTLSPTAKPIAKAYCKTTTPFSSTALERRHRRTIPIVAR